VGSFVTMASHLGNVSQGSASMAAGEATTGNYSFGNISEGNQQIANTNMMQQSYAASLKTGSFQLADGRTDMITAADGSQIMNVASSNIPVDINGSESESAQLTELQNKTYQQGLSQSQASSQNLSHSFRQSMALHEAIRKSENSGDSISQGISTEQSQALNKSHQYVKDFADQHNINMDKAASLLAEASAGIGGFGFKGSAGGRTSLNSQDQKMLQDAEKVAQSQDYQQTARESAQAAKSLSHTLTDENTRSLAADMAGSYEKGMQQRQEAAKNFSASESYGHQAMMTRANAATINASYRQQFVEWLSNQRADNTNGRIGKHGAAHIIANDPQGTVAYARRFMQEKGIVPSSPISASPATIHHNYGAENGHQAYQVSSAPLQQVRELGNKVLNGEANLRESGLSKPLSSGANFREETENRIQSNQQSIQQGAHVIAEKAELIKAKVNTAQGSSIHKNLKDKLGEEAMQTLYDAYDYLSDKKNITGEK